MARLQERNSIAGENGGSMSAPKAEFDSGGFFRALDGERVARGLTWKQVAEGSGVSASTLTRLSQGKRPDVDSLSALVGWAGLDSRDFLGGSKRGQPSELGAVLAQFRADPNLAPESAAALEDVVKAAYKSFRKR
ncbi:MAG: helix-turn-helix domain-containing protein [Thermoleophilia bacterium]